MSLAHHLDDATLMSCAAGSLPPALAVVAASHIAVCPQCRAGVADAERMGAAVLAGLTPVPIAGAPSLPGDASASTAQLPRPTPSGEVPAPLCRLVGPSLDALRWQPIGIGVWHRRVPLAGADCGDLRLIKVAPGRSVPAHGHTGAELTLVLRGAYQDSIGRFAEGDIADLDEAVEHAPVADGTTGCICVLACERPARFRGLLARLMQPLNGL